MENISTTLRTLRAKHHYRQQYIAKKLGISQPQYAKIENGDKELTISMLIKLAAIFRVLPSYLLDAIIVGLENAGKNGQGNKSNGGDANDATFYKHLSQHYEEKASGYLQMYLEVCHKHGVVRSPGSNADS